MAFFVAPINATEIFFAISLKVNKALIKFQRKQDIVGIGFISKIWLITSLIDVSKWDNGYRENGQWNKNWKRKL